MTGGQKENCFSAGLTHFRTDGRTQPRIPPAEPRNYSPLFSPTPVIRQSDRVSESDIGVCLFVVGRSSVYPTMNAAHYSDVGELLPNIE